MKGRTRIVDQISTPALWHCTDGVDIRAHVLNTLSGMNISEVKRLTIPISRGREIAIENVTESE